METWFIVVVTVLTAHLLRAFLNLLFPFKSPTHPLPPGPSTIPIIGPLLWLYKLRFEMEPMLRNLHEKYGPMITLKIGSLTAIFIADRSLAHQALVQNGSIFSDRPKPLPTSKITHSNQHNINSAAYGPTWQLLRSNLTSKILHPSCIKSYSYGRKWILHILLDCLELESKSGTPTRVHVHFQHAMFCLFILMCFGDELNHEQIKQIENAQRSVLLAFGRFNILNFWPSVTRILFQKKWEEFLNIRKNQEEVLIPLIRARKQIKEERIKKNMADKFNQKDEYVLAYVDRLLDLRLPEEEMRELDEGEMVSLCSEFLGAGMDTTSTSLQWIMANLVRCSRIQEKLFKEIVGVVGNGAKEVKEDDLQKMPYLKAVVLEGLRRHPPTHFVLPHTVTEDTVLGGYLVPKDSSINFMVADMGWDPTVWEDPMTFKPERFLSSDGEGTAEGFDITGSREIKMMPFGAGKRICPGRGLAMLHLEYFVANLVWRFEWKAVEGDEVNLEEKQEFTTVMKYPLQAHISPRKI